MPRLSEGKKALVRTLRELQKELDAGDLSPARRRVVVRQHMQTALSLSKIEQLEMRTKLDAAKPAPEPKPQPEPAMDPAVARLLGVPADWLDEQRLKVRSETAPEGPTPAPEAEPHSEETTDAASPPPAQSEPAKDDSSVADSTEDRKPEQDPKPATEPARKTDKQSGQTDTPSSAISEAALADALWDGRHFLRRQLLYSIALPGVLPPETERSKPDPGYFGLGTFMPEPAQQPGRVNNDDWLGNPIQDAQTSPAPEPEFARMENPGTGA